MIKAALINDWGNDKHQGCRLVGIAIRLACERHGIEIVRAVPGNRDWREVGMRGVHLVLINGEGTLHHGHGSDLLRIAADYPSVLLNTVWDRNPPAMAGMASRCLLRFCRESMSVAQLPGSSVVPDMTFYAEVRRGEKAVPHGHGFIGSVVGQGDIKPDVDIHDERFLEVLAGKRLVTTGRFHGITAAAMLGVPFSAWATNSCKNRGIMRDMGIERLYHDDPKRARALTPERMPATVVEYVAGAAARIDVMFSQIVQVAAAV